MENGALKMRQEILETLKKMEKRGYETHAFETAEEMKKFVLEDIGTGKGIGFGGSVTVSGLGIPAALKEQGNETYFHWEAPVEERPAVLKKAHFADAYIMSTNAITEDGVLFNIDGVGNRVSALIGGPKTVYILVGENKFTTDRDAAYKRVKEHACPLNAKRLGLKTPCGVTGKCANCLSPDSQCRHAVWTDLVPKNRRYVICVANEELGY